jgi:hypothetical protein
LSSATSSGPGGLDRFCDIGDMAVGLVLEDRG